MSKSQDPDHFFQTSHSLAETSRKAAKSSNENGAPIRLKSKILAIISDPSHPSAIYIAESAGQARRILLDTGDTTHIYRGPTTPLTSLALQPGATSTSTHKPQKNDTILVAGSWDKTTWSWNARTLEPSHRYRGHTDFVKTVTCVALPQTHSDQAPSQILISGGADSIIIIWHMSTGAKIHTLTGHTRGILCLAIDFNPQPDIPPESDNNDNYDDRVSPSIILFSGSSDREIRQWTLPLASLRIPPEPLPTNPHPHPPILAHETSVYALIFDSSSDELWTASADGTSKCLSACAGGWTTETTLPHGDYVRAVALDEVGGWVVTAGRDEDVKVWSRATGGLEVVYKGHYDEITGLVVLGGPGRREAVSVGIDGTVRRWGLGAEEIERAKREREAEEQGGDMVDGQQAGEVAVRGKDGVMTEDEERELEELMDDDDGDA